MLPFSYKQIRYFNALEIFFATKSPKHKGVAFTEPNLWVQRS